jgi:UDP-2,3-diacylglucosamine hydrolase
MERLFISDLHLCEAAPDLFLAFQNFLQNNCSNIDELYILGDLVDAWMGDDDDSAFAQKLSSTLKHIVDNGCSLFLMQGNRDFLLGETFAQAIGATLLPEAHVLMLAGERALLMHGDSLCIDDTEYQQFRAHIRSEEWQQNLLAQPLDQRRALARELRDMSQAANQVKADDIMDVNEAEVERIMAQHEASVLIHGHTHRPARHPMTERKERIVLGDWCIDRPVWVCRADDNTIEFLHLPLLTG